MSFRDTIQQAVSDEVASGVKAGLVDGATRLSHAAEQAIEHLATLHEELHAAAGKLSSHEFKRPAIEREAIDLLMNGERHGKAITQTWARENLDMDPTFREWRLERNRLEGEKYYLMSQVAVAEKRADLAIAVLNATGRGL